MRSLTAVAFVAVSLALGAATVRAQQIRTDIAGDARDAYDAAERAFLECDFASARREAERAIALEPDYPRAYDLLLSTPQPDEEKAVLRARLAALPKADPKRAAFWYAAGRASEDFDEQQRAFAKVVELAPESPWGYAALGYVARHRKEFDRALELYAKAEALAPNEPAIVSGIASTLIQAGRVPEGNERLNALLVAAPSTTAAESALEFAVDGFRLDQRLMLAEWYVSYFPRGRSSGRMRNVTLDELGARDPTAALARAREYLRTGASGDRGAWTLMLTRDAEKRGRPAMDSLVHEVDSWHTTDPLVWMNLASVYRSAPDYAARGEVLFAKAEQLAEAATVDRDRTLEIVRAGRDQFRLEVLARTDPAAAAARARELIATADAHQKPFLFHYILNDARFGSPKGMERLVRHTLAADDLDASTLATLAQVCDASTFDPALGAALFSRALDRYSVLGPNMRVPELVVMLHVKLAEARRRSGDRDGSIAALVAIDPHARNAGVYRGFARVYADAGDSACRLDALVRETAASQDDSSRASLLDAAKRAGRTEAEANALVARSREESVYPAPDFTLDVLGGGKVTLSQLRGKVVLVNFWFPACGPCRQELPEIQKVYETYRARGLDVLAIDMSSSNADAAAFFKEKGLTFRELPAGSSRIEDVYGTRSAPTTYVVDRAGRVVFVETGYGADDTIPKLRSIVEPLLARP